MAVCNVYLTLSDAFYFTANYCNQNNLDNYKKTTDYCSGWTYTIQQSCVKLGLGLYEAPARVLLTSRSLQGQLQDFSKSMIV